MNQNISDDVFTNIAPDEQPQPSTLSRRKFVEMASSAAIAFSILPRHVLGGKGFVAPSDKITLAYIGIGTQGINEMLPMLAVPGIQIISVCDPNKEAVGYRDWSADGLKNQVRKAINKPNWQPGGDNTIPGGREAGKDIVNSYYANVRKDTSYKGCTAYADVRELLDKEKDVDAVKIMTPDHLHGILCMAAIKRGKHVIVHKPISNRLIEGKQVIDMARKSKVITHLVPWDSNGPMENIMAWINAGAIGTLKEVHCWTNRPVWPQYSKLPTDKTPVPEGFDWNLWLGPEADRAYSPNYTNMVFRGWYDFGGGCMADMGHYSLWSVFNALQLTSPTMVIPNRTHVCDFNGSVPYRIDNNFSFPTASMVRFMYPANGSRQPVDLCWYDGGMRPPTTELLKDDKELPEEGQMFVGESGTILAGFNLQNPQIISGKKMEAPNKVATDTRSQVQQTSEALPKFVAACKSGQQYDGNFRQAEAITEAVNLYAAALRSNRLLKYDGANRKITNVAEANTYLKREYRKGWSPDAI